MANLLQKASIVLTPTAYDNGKVLCAKPSEAPYGDFDFSRNSAATRVNAQGLVENVQILSSNLVQNGDFSEEGVQEVSNGSFSQEGVQLVTNGDFSNGTTNWSNPTYSGDNSASLSIDNGTLKIEKNADLDWRSSFVSQTPIVYVSGKTYKITYSLKDGNTSGADVYVRTNFARSASTVDIKTLTSDWVEYTDYYVADASADDISFGILAWQNAGNGEYYFIDNVSVREVGQDWSLGTGWSIGEDKAVAVSGASTKLIQSISGLSGKICKVSLTLSDYGGNGSVRVDFGSVSSDPINTNGEHTIYGTYDNNAFELFKNTGFSGSITNISVKEVGMDWTLGTGVSIGSNEAVFTSTPSGQSVGQNAVAAALPNGALAKVSFEVLTRTEGTFGIYFSGTLVGTLASAGVFTGYFTKGTETSFYIRALGTTSGTISNVNVIQITDDTNLPRINYEGFSYQDDLGSELVVNGGFDDGENDWDFSGDWELVNGTAEIQSSTNSFLVQSNVVDLSVKTYKLQYEVVTTNGSNFRLAGGNSAFGSPTLDSATIGAKTVYLTSNGTKRNLQFNQNAFRGSIDNISVKEYSGQEVVPNSGCGSWLFEPQSTNLITYSSDYTQWNKSGSMVITSNNAISPDGTQNASLLTANAANQFIYLSSFSSANSTISLYIKRKTGTGNIELSNNGGASYTVLSVTDEWSRVQVTFATSTNQTVIKINTSGDEIYLWGAQLEALSYASSLIPTSGSSVTRNQDVCNNGATGAGLINSTEGVLYAEIAALADGVGTRTMSLSDGTANNSITIRYTTSVGVIQAFVVSGGSFQFNANISGVSVLNFNKVAIKYSLNDMALWINGVEVATDTSGTMPLGLNEINFTRGDGANKFFSKTKALAVWKEALTDQELADLTYPTPTDPTFSLDFDTIAEQFTFARGSEATYVDAQGLIQSTNELGEELVVNGDFATDSDWNKVNATISDGKGNLDSTSGTSLLFQSALVVGKSYKATLEVSNYNGLGICALINSSGATQFAITSDGNKDFYFTHGGTNANLSFRATNGGIFSIDNVSVKEVTTATNTPRLDYSTGAEAFLLEPQRTNLVVNSSLGSPKTPYDGATNYLAPDGASSAFTPLVSTSSNRFESVINGGNYVSGTELTYSWYRKRISTPLDPSFLGDLDVKSFVNATFSSTTQIASDISGYDRFSVKVTITDGSLESKIRAYYGSLIGVGNSSVAYWGHQLELGSYATSYIPTSGTTVTRNQETCINATPEINSEEGVLYAEISALADDGTYRLISLNDGSSANIVQMYYAPAANRISAEIKVGNVAQAGFNYTVSDTTDIHKIAFKYKENDFALWIDGVEVGTDASGAVLTAGTLTELDFSIGSGSFPFYGNTKDIQVYTKALSDAELIKLTT